MSRIAFGTAEGEEEEAGEGKHPESPALCPAAPISSIGTTKQPEQIKGEEPPSHEPLRIEGASAFARTKHLG